MQREVNAHLRALLNFSKQIRMQYLVVFVLQEYVLEQKKRDNLQQKAEQSLVVFSATLTFCHFCRSFNGYICCPITSRVPNQIYMLYLNTFITCRPRPTCGCKKMMVSKHNLSTFLMRNQYHLIRTTGPVHPPSFDTSRR